jgi:serine/threonine-protein kinase/endoribonuclease IRE1
MDESVKKMVGPLAGGYLGYWSRRFPKLLMACYEAVHEAGLEKEDRFKGYFTTGAQ